MPYPFLVIVFVFGLAVGSFLNVLAMRYQPGGKLLATGVLSGRSRCTGCGNRLRWYELIPIVSFVVQKGKCRSCHMQLSFQYPLIELLSGLFALGAAYRLSSLYRIWQFGEVSSLPSWYYLFFLVWLGALATLILISLIDLKFSIIPDQLNLFLLFLGFFNVILQSVYDKFGIFEGSFLGYHALPFGFRENVWLNHLFGAALGLVVFGIIIIITRGRAMGIGDLKMAAVLGFLFGWPDVVLIIVLSFVVGALWSLFAIARGKKTMKDMVPFGPFIALGAFMVFFAGFWIMNGYFNLFGLI